MRYAAYFVAGFVAAVATIVCYSLCAIAAQSDRRAASFQRTKPTLTVIWRDTDVMLMSFTGTVELVGDYHMRITDENGFCQMVDRRDVVEVH